MLTTQQSFVVGALARCADEGLDRPALEKRASMVDKFLKLLVATSGVGRFGLGLAAVLPPAVGAGVGYMAGLEPDVDQVDAETMKREELIGEYRRLAERANRSAARRSYRAI